MEEPSETRSSEALSSAARRSKVKAEWWMEVVLWSVLLSLLSLLLPVLCSGPPTSTIRPQR